MGGLTALHVAAANNRKKIVRELLEKGGGDVRLDVKNKWGKTAKDLAVGKGHLEIARMIEAALLKCSTLFVVHDTNFMLCLHI